MGILTTVQSWANKVLDGPEGQTPVHGWTSGVPTTVHSETNGLLDGPELLSSDIRRSTDGQAVGPDDSPFIRWSWAAFEGRQYTSGQAGVPLTKRLSVYGQIGFSMLLVCPRGTGVGTQMDKREPNDGPYMDK